jgi:hypothetical protein
MSSNPSVREEVLGMTPPYLTTFGGYVDVVKLPLEYGANPNTKNKDG